MKVAVQGLGRMGMQIVRKLIESGHEVIATNRTPEAVATAVSFGATAAHTADDVRTAFGTEQVILWMMIPSDAVDTELDVWLTKLPRGSIIIDGGNSDYRLTLARAEKATAAGLQLLDSGTSGGVWGYEKGFSMMIGGDMAAYTLAEPLFSDLSKPSGGYHYFGPSGAGHYVKMVHNAIEYGMMESLAEGYRMLKEGPYKDLNLAEAGAVWQKGSVVESWLNELTRQVIFENPQLEGIPGVVAESGEARWTIETAKELGIPLPAIEAAFNVRLASQKGEVNFATKLLAAMRNKFGGHSVR